MRRLVNGDGGGDVGVHRHRVGEVEDGGEVAGRRVRVAAVARFDGHRHQSGFARAKPGGEVETVFVQRDVVGDIGRAGGIIKGVEGGGYIDAGRDGREGENRPDKRVVDIQRDGAGDRAGDEEPDGRQTGAHFHRDGDGGARVAVVRFNKNGVGGVDQGVVVKDADERHLAAAVDSIVVVIVAVGVVGY